jgi:hypothetical protein
MRESLCCDDESDAINEGGVVLVYNFIPNLSWTSLRPINSLSHDKLTMDFFSLADSSIRSILFSRSHCSLTLADSHLRA